MSTLPKRIRGKQWNNQNRKEIDKKKDRGMWDRPVKLKIVFTEKKKITSLISQIKIIN